MRRYIPISHKGFIKSTKVKQLFYLLFSSSAKCLVHVFLKIIRSKCGVKKVLEVGIDMVIKTTTTTKHNCFLKNSKGLHIIQALTVSRIILGGFMGYSGGRMMRP